MKVLITDFDGYNVHNPKNSHEYVEFETFEKARAFADSVEKYGWAKCKEILECLKK